MKNRNLFIVVFIFLITTLAYFGWDKENKDKKGILILQKRNDLSFVTLVSERRDDIIFGKDSVINGKELFFFWYSPGQLERTKMAAGFNYPPVIVHHYVNNCEYTEISHNSRPSCPDSKLIFVGDSLTKIFEKGDTLDFLSTNPGSFGY